MRAVDRVRDVGLVVLDLEPGAGEQIARAPRERDVDHRVLTSVSDQYAQVLTAVRLRPPALDARHEARACEDPGRRQAIGAEPERVAHHGPHREAAEDRLLGSEPGAAPQLLMRLGEGDVRGGEGVGVRVANPGREVPVVARPARHTERRPRRDDVQPPLGIERIADREQVVLVGPPPVVQKQ